MKRFLVLILAACLSVSLTGCAVFQAQKVAKVAPLTPDQQIAAYVDDFSASVKEAQGLEIQFFHQGQIEKEYHVAIQKGFKKVSDAGPKLVVASQLKGKAFQDQVDIVAAQLSDQSAMSLAHIKNPASQAALKILFDQAAQTLKLISASKEGK